MSECLLAWRDVAFLNGVLEGCTLDGSFLLDTVYFKKCNDTWRELKSCHNLCSVFIP